MVWRWKFLRTISRPVWKPPVLVPIRNIQSSIFCLSDDTQFTANLNRETQSFLTQKIVLSTLLNCPSDLLALSFFLWCARQPNYFHDRRAYDQLVGVVTRLALQYKTVKRVIDQLKNLGCVTKPQTFLVLLRTYWHGKMYSLVFEAFEEMLDHGFVPNTFARNIVMDVLFKLRKVDVALNVLNETQFSNFLTYGIAICNLCKLADLVTLRNVLRDMLRNGYILDAETSLLVLNCYCKMGRFAEAFQVLALMITSGISISAHVWGILIDGFCKSGRLSLATSLLEKMIENGRSPNVVICTSLIKGFMQSQMTSSALRIIRIMESKGFSHDLVLCNVLIDCYSKIGMYDDALDVFFSMPKWNLLPDSFTFCSLMSTVVLSRQFDLLPVLISGFAIKADMVVCNRLLTYFCKAGYPVGATEFYDDMIDRGFTPDMYSYIGLLSGLCGEKRIDEAVKVYRGIVMNHPCDVAHIHTVMMSELIKAGKFHKAIKLFRKAILENYALDVVSYTVAIHGLLKGGRAGEACTLFNQMKEIGVAPNEHTYRVMLSGLCRERDVSTVKHIIEEMIDAGIPMDHNTVNKVNNLLLRTPRSHSVSSLFTKLVSSSMPENALLLNAHAHGVRAGNAHISLSKVNSVDALDVDISSSDDLSDVAASVG